MLGFGAFGQYAFGEAPAATGYNLDISVASYTLTLQSADLEYGRALSISAGSFALTFQTTALSLKMPFAVGAFTATMVTTGIRAGRFIAWSPTPTPKISFFGFGAFGQNAFGGSTALVADNTFSLSLGTVFLRQGKALPIDVGAFTVAMQGTAITYGRAIAPEAAAYALTFQTVALRIVMPFAVGTYAVTFNPVEFTRSSVRIRRFPRVGSSSAKSRSMGAGVKARAYGG